jgi:hypothetical protein
LWTRCVLRLGAVHAALDGAAAEVGDRFERIAVWARNPGHGTVARLPSAFGRSIGEAVGSAIAPGDADATYVLTGVPCDMDRELWVVDTLVGSRREKVPVSTRKPARAPHV